MYSSQEQCTFIVVLYDLCSEGLRVARLLSLRTSAIAAEATIIYSYPKAFRSLIVKLSTAFVFAHQYAQIEKLTARRIIRRDDYAGR